VILMGNDTGSILSISVGEETFDRTPSQQGASITELSHVVDAPAAHPASVEKGADMAKAGCELRASSRKGDLHRLFARAVVLAEQRGVVTVSSRARHPAFPLAGAEETLTDDDLLHPGPAVHDFHSIYRELPGLHGRRENAPIPAHDVKSFTSGDDLASTPEMGQVSRRYRQIPRVFVELQREAVDTTSYG